MESGTLCPSGAAGPHSFIIRLWLEPHSSPPGPEWRWHVCHVQSGGEGHFRTLSSVLLFIEQKARVPGPQYRESEHVHEEDISKR
ncbi:MAG: hypothetical protein HY686_00990 [Chloroflexi bacterium]|nr:hypothetical protein [Chloroflexota bacterium]